MAIQAPINRKRLSDILNKMSLTPETFEVAMGIGAAESRTYGPGAPKSAPEFNRWARTVESVHHSLIPTDQGWERYDPMNLPFFLNPSISIGLVVSSGDEATGSPLASPSNRNPKGASFGRLVDENGQAAFFGTVRKSGATAEAKETWMFLYNERGGRVFGELSLPLSAPKGFVADWAHRIIFPSYDLTANRFVIAEADETPDYGFSIERL